METAIRSMVQHLELTVLRSMTEAGDGKCRCTCLPYNHHPPWECHLGGLSMGHRAKALVLVTARSLSPAVGSTLCRLLAGS